MLIGDGDVYTENIENDDQNINPRRPPASTISTQLVLTNLLLGLTDLPDVGFWALILTMTMLFLVGGLRLLVLPRLLGKADLSVLNKAPKSCLGRIQWGLTRFLTMFFTCYSSFIQSLQLQSSKVSEKYVFS